MATVKEIYEYLDGLFPRGLSCDWDNDGLMVCGDFTCEVKKALLTLDVTEKVVDYAEKSGCDLIISHHPLIFRKLAGLSEDYPSAALPMRLLRSGISVISLHTRFDAGNNGMNDTIAALLGLEVISDFGPDGEKCGRLCRCDIPLDALCEKIKKATGAPVLSVSKAGEVCRTVAILGGDGKDFVFAAVDAGADVFITGDAGYNVMLDAAAQGLTVIEAGHYYTEYLPFVMKISSLLGKKFPDLETETCKVGCEITII